MGTCANALTARHTSAMAASTLLPAFFKIIYNAPYNLSSCACSAEHDTHARRSFRKDLFSSSGRSVAEVCELKIKKNEQKLPKLSMGGFNTRAVLVASRHQVYFAPKESANTQEPVTPSTSSCNPPARRALAESSQRAGRRRSGFPHGRTHGLHSRRF